MQEGFRESVPCVASSAAADTGRHTLGHRSPIRFVYCTVDQV
jgi:hypothetical protein